MTTQGLPDVRPIGTIGSSPVAAGTATIDPASGAPGWRAHAGAAAATRIDPLGRDALLRRLLKLMVGTRLVMAAVGWAVILMLWRDATDALAWRAIITSAVIAVALTLGAVARLRAGGSIGENTFLVHLMGDVLTLTYLMSQVGDPQSLKLCIYLIPLSLAAYALTGRRLAAATGGIVLAVALLFNVERDGVEAMGPHAIAHQASEMVAIVLVALMAYAMAMLLRHHQRAVLRLREAAISEQGSQALAAMAVRTADAISTPLTTMSVLVHELRSGRLEADESAAALHEVTRQIDRCKAHVSDIVASAGRARADDGRRVPLDELVEAAVEQCMLMTPALQVEVAPLTSRPPDVVDERSLFDALVLLIQHRGREPSGTVRIVIEWNDHSIVVRLCSAAAPGGDSQDASDAMVALAASLLDRWSGSVTFESYCDRHCSRIELPRLGACLDPPDP